MSNRDSSAFPIPIAGSTDGCLYSSLEQGGGINGGLTKREYFAGLAMQGFAAGPSTNLNDLGDMMKAAVQWADTLLEELEKAELEELENSDAGT